MFEAEMGPEGSFGENEPLDAGVQPATNMPELSERLAALTTVSRAVAAQSGVTHSAALDAVYAAAKTHMPNLVLQLAAIDLPEPLLSEALITAGLNAPFMHSPTYAFPEVKPGTGEDEREARERETRRRRLVDAYDILSELEQSIRQLIEEKLRELHGDHWWKRGVPDSIRRRCEERKQAKEGPN